MARAKNLAAWIAKVKDNWSKISIELVQSGPAKDLQVSANFSVQAKVQLSQLKPEDVSMELYLGQVNSEGEIVEGKCIPMQSIREDGEATYLYQANDVMCERSGKHGYTIRVIPRHSDLIEPFLPELILWA
jgi:starch phosphorylase